MLHAQIHGDVGRRDRGRAVASIAMIDNPQLRAAAGEITDAMLDETGPIAFGATVALNRVSLNLPVSAIQPYTAERAAACIARCEELRRRLDSADRHGLSAADAVSSHVLRHIVERVAREASAIHYEIPVTPYRSFLFTIAYALGAEDFRSAGDRERYLDAAAMVPAYIATVFGELREAARRGIVVPAVALDAVVESLRRAAGRSESSPLYVPDSALSGVHAPLAERFKNALEAIIARTRPHLEAMAAFVDGEYRSRAPQTVGFAQYPGGDEYYARLARETTTTTASPQEMHDVGLHAVAVAADAMAQLRAGRFSGDENAFHDVIRGDSVLRPRHAADIAAALRRSAARAVELLPAIVAHPFGEPFEVQPLPASMEQTITFGYYQPGDTNRTATYFFNGSNLSERWLPNYATLALHELVPGHHLEHATVRASGDLPSFRKGLGSTVAYHEGWAEYAAELGHDLGLYDDFYDRYARHAFDRTLCARLVVDTGMNALDWTAERARTYLRANSLLADSEIDTEILRYGTDLPAQALGYKAGMLEFVKLRQRAQSALGARFHAGRFHSHILQGGPMPFTALHHQIDAFITREQAAQTRDTRAESQAE
jgi:uncharacterized protein (DUF885 family)